MANENHILLSGARTERRQVAEFRAAFKHKSIPNFKVNKFQFVKGILRIESDSEEEFKTLIEEFMRAYDGLHGSDKAAIVKIKEVQNEESLSHRGPSAIRGAVGTHQIADKEVAQAPNAPAPAVKSFFSRPQ